MKAVLCVLKNVLMALGAFIVWLVVSEAIGVGVLWLTLGFVIGFGCGIYAMKEAKHERP